MTRQGLRTSVAFLAGGLFLAGCATIPPWDYSNFRQAKPRSILVLPPDNQSTDVRGTYGYLSTVTRPLAELGYYVFPVALVDELLKENGLPSPGEMHQAPLRKLAEIFGTDSVLYITLVTYGTKYRVFNSAAMVQAKGKLVDAKTGTVLWEGEAQAEQVSNSGGGGLLGALVGAAVSQVVGATSDAAHVISADANSLLFTGQGLQSFEAHAHGSGGPALLYGPYRPESQNQ